MNAEERAQLVNDLRGVVENREKLTADVREILKAEIPKLVAEATRGLRPPPLPDPSQFVEAAEFQERIDAAGGDLPPGVESPVPRRSGLNYVVGTPPMAPVLRALKQPLFDTLIIPEDGILAEAEVSLFTDGKKWPDGRRKFRRHCNMTQDGMLGYPLEYDFSSLELRFEKWANPGDVHAVLRGLHLAFYFGQNVPFLRLAASGFTPLIALPHEVESMEEEVRRQIVAFAKDGVWPAWTHPMTTTDGKPRRISSVESFRCGVECTVPELYGPVTLKVQMQDTLYAQL